MPVSSPVRRAAAAIVLALAAACSDQTPTAPSGPDDLTGRWFSSDSRLRLDLVQSGPAVQGTVVYLDGTAPPATIVPEVTPERFGFRVVTGSELATFLDPPEMVEHGWRVSATVAGSRMTGTISWFGIPGRYPRVIQDITFVRAGGTR
jgi:hypothetical protein